MSAATTHGPGLRFVHPALQSADVMSIGGSTFRYDDVARFAVGSVTERDWHGQLLCAGCYGLASSLFLIGVLLGVLDLKFLIAVVCLGAIGAMSLGDARAVPTVTVHTLDMVLRNGRRVRFVDGDTRVVAALAAWLERAGAKRVS